MLASKVPNPGASPRERRTRAAAECEEHLGSSQPQNIYNVFPRTEKLVLFIPPNGTMSQFLVFCKIVALSGNSRVFCTQWATQKHRDRWPDAPGLQKKRKAHQGENGLFLQAHSGVIGRVEGTREKAAYKSQDRGKGTFPFSLAETWTALGPLPSPKSDCSETSFK